jgi:alanine dehydrogenase
MQVLTEDDVRARLQPDRLIAAIETAFRERFASLVVPPRTQMNLAAGIFLAMPCYDRAGNALGMKLVVVQDRPNRPGERVQATYILLEPETAQPKLVLAANYLTDLRTAVTSAVATKFLAREDARVLGIFGTGRLARAHLRALPRVRSFERVLVCGRTDAASREFAQSVSPEIGLPVEAVDARFCAAESDVICTCTNSPGPLFEGSELRPGTHLNLTGAFQPQKREADSVTIQRSRIFVETYDGVLAQAGDLLIPIGESLIDRGHIVGDLHELVSGKKQGRVSSDSITLFKSVGCALEDLVSAELLRFSIPKPSNELSNP